MGGGWSVRQYLGNVSAQEAASYAVVKCITQYFHMATAVAASTQTEFRIRLLYPVVVDREALLEITLCSLGSS